MIVVDASVAVDFLLGAGSPAGDTLAGYLSDRETVCSPHLVDAEVAQTLRRFVIAVRLSGETASEMVTDMVDLPIRRYPHKLLLARAFQLRENVTVYDALYLALAEALECRLLTGDGRLAAVPGCNATVEVMATSN